MPKMDGLTFLKKLMTHYPLPVIIFSSAAQANNAIALEAFSLGAVDVVGKPGESLALDDTIRLLQNRIVAASNADMRFFSQPHENIGLGKETSLHDPLGLVAMGASTGGPIALEQILTAMPATMAPIAIAQHMPPSFTRNFANRLNSLCDVVVKEAEHGEWTQSGYVYIAPGDRHLQVNLAGGRYQLAVNQRPRVLSQRPSADILFESVAKACGVHGVGVLLTGMGRDGAHGLLKMKEAGGMTIAQDATSCIIPGMPVAAIKLGAAQKIVTLDRMAATIINLCLGRSKS
jgi:two-component system chemotaxis response regulator CheB